MTRIKKLVPNAIIPTRGTGKSAGLDLYACLNEKKKIKPGETVSVNTGIAVALPQNTVGLVYARSGLGIKKGIIPANAVGVIDEDYRGELIVGLYNYSNVEFTVSHGDRIAQLLITPILYEQLTECDELDETIRGEGGFGSTGR